MTVNKPGAPGLGTSILDERQTFCEKYLVDAKGRRFSLKGREWIRDNLWAALDGYRLIAAGDKPCDACCAVTASQAITLDPHNRPCATAGIGLPKCAGLKATPIIVTVASLERRAGKTFGVGAGYSLSSLYKQRWRSILYIAAAQSQSKDLVFDNFKRPVMVAPILRRRTKIVEQTVSVASMHTSFEFVATSHRSITGRGKSLVIVDEAKDVKARTAAALLPSILENHGWECPDGCVRLDAKDAGDMTPPNGGACPECGLELKHWQGRILIMSSAGIITAKDEERWFPELVEKLEDAQARERGDPNAYLFRMDSGANPLKSVTAQNAIERVFGSMPSMSQYIAAEMGNVFVEQGGEYIPTLILKSRCTASQIEGSLLRSVGFLDPSDVEDLTSLVILSEVEASWARIRMTHLNLWDPKNMPSRVIEWEVIFARLAELLPKFPNLLKCWIDMRGVKASQFAPPMSKGINGRTKRSDRSWPTRLVDKAMGTPWGQLLQPYRTQDVLRRDAGWAQLKRMLMTGHIELLNHPRIFKEFAGIRVKYNKDGSETVVDRSRKTMHLEVMESVALILGELQAEGIGATMRLASANAKLSRTRDIVSNLVKLDPGQF